MPSRTRPAMYNTPTLRNGGFGALQVEAITNRPLSIARRHLAASQLRMRDIEPDQLTSSDWVRFLVMTTHERDRWMSDYVRRRRDSDASAASSSSNSSSTSAATSTGDHDRDTAAAMAAAGYDKAEEARRDSEREQVRGYRVAVDDALSAPTPSVPSAGVTPSASLWAREFDERNDAARNQRHSTRRPRPMRRAATDGVVELPPTYENAVRARTPPPAYEPRSDDERSASPTSPMSEPRRIRFDV